MGQLLGSGKGEKRLAAKGINNLYTWTISKINGVEFGDGGRQRTREKSR